MHVLILPSEEFVPNYCPVAGIFQYHQAAVLKEAGHKVGALSVRLSFSIPMLLKAVALRCFGKKANNATDAYSVKGLVELGYRKIFRPETFIQTEEKNGISIVRIDGFYYTPPVDNRNHYGWVKAGHAAFRYYLKHYGKPDVLHAHNALYAGLLAKKLSEVYRIPYVLTEHSTAFAQRTVNEPAVLRRIKKAYDKSRFLFAVSQPFSNLLNGLFNTNRFECLPNVLDSYLEKKEFNLKKNGRTDFVFLNIAELHPKKDHLTLLKAFEKVHRLYPHTKLWIGGGGELSDALKTYAAELCLNGSVRFWGPLNRDKVYEAIVQSDCFVLSSRFETFGVVVIEAMLFGKPAIVTRCGGPEAFVTEAVGYVVEKENETQLADAMAKMIEQYSRFDPAAIRQYTITHFGKEKFLQRTGNILRSATLQPD